jgi:SAM-dependent methyltransferase
LLLVVFSAAVFANAALLFSIQPMFTKMVLPLLGGTPAVWNTCLLFFQAVLLGGYLYAHLSSQYLTMRVQAGVHIGLLLLTVLLLPIQIPGGWSQPPDSAMPIGWLLGLLTVALGLPFFLLSAGAPMLQRWFSQTGHPSAHNPYFLYAASNLGSFIALLTYPFVIEPRLGVAQQSALWRLAYVVLLTFITVSAFLAMRGRRRPSDPAPDETLGVRGAPTLVPDASLRARWVLYAFVPSSMLIGVTTYLSTDIASVPFLWIVPLSLYLLTFVIVFARRQVVPRWLILHGQLLLGLPTIVSLCLRAEGSIVGPATLHLLAFFATALMCHRALADLSPRPEHLTEFYLWMSFGGVLGGAFNVLLAPLLFNFPLEYPLALLLGFSLRPSMTEGIGRAARILDFLFPALVGVGVWFIYMSPRPPEAWFPQGSQLFLVAVMFAVFFFWKRPLRLALGAGAMYAAVQLVGMDLGNILWQERSFFGVYRVRRVEDNHVLLHGTTTHGAQSLDPARRTDPLTYYHRGSPVADVLAQESSSSGRRIGVVGLGAGALACYGAVEDTWSFYEIDPLVARVARDARWFTYLRDCLPKAHVVIGDARLKLAGAPDNDFDIIIVDAFSSDAIPVHLLTREALSLYQRKLKPDGVLAFHISNRFLDLRPVLAALANDASLPGVVGVRTPDRLQRDRLYDESRWVVLAKSLTRLERFAQLNDWEPLGRTSSVRLWTDDYSDVLSAINW